LFNTYNEAEEFAKRWKGHPHWCKPSVGYEIVEVDSVYRQELIGYKRKE
jgi:hypothetical protein